MSEPDAMKLRTKRMSAGNTEEPGTGSSKVSTALLAARALLRANPNHSASCITVPPIPITISDTQRSPLPTSSQPSGINPSSVILD